MEMEMVNHLASLPADVEHELVPLESRFLREHLRAEDERRDNVLMISFQMNNGLDMLLRHHEVVNRRRRADILERHEVRSLVHEIGGDFLPSDLAE